MNNNETAGLLNEKQAAEYLSTSVKTIQDWRLRRVGPSFVKLGRSVRYRRADLDAWIAASVVLTGGAG